jgi:hypothetical protein
MSKQIDREELKKRVAVRADEYIVSADNVSGGTAAEAPIETIESELDYSALYVLRNANEELLFSVIESDLKHHHGDSVNDSTTRLIFDSGDNPRVRIPCPSDFLRFVALKLSSWDQEAREILSPRDPAYKDCKRSYQYGNYSKPKVFLTSFSEYEMKVTGSITGTFTVGETVNLSNSGVSGEDSMSGVVKQVESGYIILKTVSGSLTGRSGDVLTGASSGATIDTITSTQDEYNKYDVIKKYTSNQDTADLYNGQTVDSLALATGDIVVLSAQTDSDENGTYLIGANANALTKLSEDIDPSNKNRAMECFRAVSSSDTIDIFHYVPHVLPENFPLDMQDMLIDYTAGRVLKFMGQYDAANLAFASAAELMGLQKQGFKGEA